MAMDDLVPDLIEETDGVSILARDLLRLHKFSDQHIERNAAPPTDIQADSKGQIARRPFHFRRQ
jgi:hypothetical protein